MHLRNPSVSIFDESQMIQKTDKTMTTLERQFAQTVAEHKSTIYTVCYMFSQDADEVNDLFQEVLVNLWKGFESFEHRSDIKTWIYRVALNTCISIDRKKKKVSTILQRRQRWSIWRMATLPLFDWARN